MKPFTCSRKGDIIVYNINIPNATGTIDSKAVKDKEIIMETKYYTVARIDGDYAWLQRTDAEEEPLFIARALLPEEIDEGTNLKYELLQYEII